MHFQLSIVSVIALAASTVLAGPEPFVSQNAAARHAALQRALEEKPVIIAPVRRAHAAHARRTIDLDGGRRFIARRATPDQLAAQAKLNAYAAKLAETNAKWQKNVMEDLKAGKTPKTFDQFAAGQQGASVSVSSSSSSVSSELKSNKPAKKPASLAKVDTDNNDDDEDDEEDDDDDGEDEDDEEDDEEEEDNTPAQKPVAKPEPQQPKPQPQPETPEQPASSSGPVSHGDGTFYGTGLGACGETNNDSDFIAAIAADRYDSLGVSNGSGSCGRRAKVCYQDKCTEIEIKDRCVICKWDDIDLSPAAFNKIADPALGRIKVTWNFLDGKP